MRVDAQKQKKSGYLWTRKLLNPQQNDISWQNKVQYKKHDRLCVVPPGNSCLKMASACIQHERSCCIG